MIEHLLALHFIRPGWLLLIPVWVLFIRYLKIQSSNQTGFEQDIDTSLLPYLDLNSSVNQSSDNKKTINESITSKDTLKSRLPYWLLMWGWIIATIALAGPTWNKLPQPLHESEQAMVIILDLSPSMLATDNKPSRMVRARLKVQDLLTQRKDGLTALVVYAGEAHIVSPLTDDSNTIINLLPTLEPGLLPIPGSNIEMAVTTAKQLLRDSGYHSGDNSSLVVVTDGIDSNAVDDITQSINNELSLFILGVGTSKGAPIPLGPLGSSSKTQAGFLRDSNDNIVTAARNDSVLKQLAQENSGYYLPLQADDSDIDFIIDRLNLSNPLHALTQQHRKQEREMDQWEELGPTLLLLSLPLFALAFRKGWLLVLAISIFPTITPQTAYAFSWSDLWLNKDQQAQQAFDKQDYATAQEQFEHYQWKGSAAYKNQQYQAAIDEFSQGNMASDYYNKGNAHAQLGQFDEAIEAYDQALAKDPTLDDAKTNKALVEELKKQEQQQEQQNQEQNQDGSSDNNQNQQSSQSDNQQQESSEQKQEQGQQEKNSETSQAETGENQQNNDKNNNEDSDSNAENQATQLKSQEDTAEESEENKQTSDADSASLAHLSEEEKHELEQWLRKVPDDPSGLLRRKFEYEFQKRRQLYQSGQWELPDNNAHQRY